MPSIKELELQLKIIEIGIQLLVKGGEGSGCTGDNCGRPRGSGSKPTGESRKPKEPETATPEADSEVGGFKVSDKVKQSYSEYKAALAPIEAKIRKADKVGRAYEPTEKERAAIIDASAKLQGAKNEFFSDNGLSKEQADFLEFSNYKWVESPNNSQSMVMRQVASEITGGDFSKEYMNTMPLMEHEVKYAGKDREATEAKLGGKDKLTQAVKAEIAFNQAMFKQDHPDGITVYRGIYQDSKPSGESVSMSSNSLSSFTASEYVATSFANMDKKRTGVVLSKKITEKDVALYSRGNPAMMTSMTGVFEQEVVLKANKNKIEDLKVVKARAPKKSNDNKQLEGRPTDFENFLHRHARKSAKPKNT